MGHFLASPKGLEEAPTISTTTTLMERIVPADWNTKKHSAADLTRQALNWATESIGAMIEAHTPADGPVIDPEHVAGLKNLRNQMLAYRKKRFGWTYDPTHGAKKMDALSRKPIT